MSPSCQFKKKKNVSLMSMTNFLMYKDIYGSISINMPVETQFHAGNPHQIDETFKISDGS